MRCCRVVIPATSARGPRYLFATYSRELDFMNPVPDKDAATLETFWLQLQPTLLQPHEHMLLSRVRVRVTLFTVVSNVAGSGTLATCTYGEFTACTAYPRCTVFVVKRSLASTLEAIQQPTTTAINAFIAIIHFIQ